MIPTEKLLEIKSMCEFLEKPMSYPQNMDEIIDTHKRYQFATDPEAMKQIIDELISAREVIGFYADNKSWCKDRPSSVRYDIIYPHDVDELDSAPRIFGGIRAREHQRKFSV